MNTRAFLRNCAKARIFCPHPADRFKYLYWLYSKSQPFASGNRQTLTIRFELGESVGKAALTVRCNGGSDAFIFSEVFEHRYYDFDLLEPPRTILDVGANAGFTGLFLAPKYPKADLACVEPMADNVRLLRTNIVQNSLTAKVVPKALCVTDHPVMMQIAKSDCGHKVADMKFGRALEGGTLEVPGISVLTLMGELGWKRIGLLKMDIEGSKAFFCDRIVTG
jgi:FkbM family methyltransferase